MYNEGAIIYFTPFIFSNGTSKEKFFVVLKNIGNTYILASLPTKQDHIPSENINQRGCIEIPEYSFNCFLIPKTEIVTECGKKFKLQTHLYGEEIINRTMAELESTYMIEGINYQIWGQMKKELFDELITCFKNANNVKRKYKKIL